MVGMRRGLASRRILPDAEVAQDLRADAVGARVPFALRRAVDSALAGQAGEQGLAVFRAVQQDDDAVAVLGQRRLRLVDRNRIAACCPDRGSRAPRAVHARAPAFRRRPRMLALDQRQMRGAAGAVDIGVQREFAVGGGNVLAGRRARPAFRCRRGSGSGRRWCRSSGRVRAAKSIRSGRRAIVPSSFMISQITDAGSRPAMPARSQPASVWPARTSTPPSLRRAAERCGRAGRGRRPWRCWPRRPASVRARSAAEMPVVTPSAASIETVKAVPCWVPVVARHLRQAAACRQRSSVSVRQIRPRPCVAMKLMASGVTCSAARTRSPSFSRSSSSTRMTMRPAFSSATISVVVAMAGWGDM